MNQQSKINFIIAIQANASALLNVLQSQEILMKQFNLLGFGIGGANAITPEDITAAIPNTNMTPNELGVFMQLISNISTDSQFTDLFIMAR